MASEHFGDGPDRDPLVGDRVQGGSRGGLLQRRPEETRGIEPGDGGPAVGAVTDIAGDAGCPTVNRPADECDLLGANPVHVEATGYNSLQIATLPGHDLGDGMHIRFTFARSLGLHCLVVSAWQDRPTRCTERTLCRAASRAGARALWRVLSETLTVSAHTA